MNVSKHVLVQRLSELQTVANAMAGGADRVAVQAALAALIRAAADANACGPLRAGIELPAAT